MNREPLRPLSPEEVAVVEPWLQRRARALAVIQGARAAVDAADATLASLAMMAGGPGAMIDPDTRTLYREVRDG